MKMRKLVKLWVEVGENGKYSILYTSKELQSGVLIENLSAKQAEGVINLLRAIIGKNVFVAGKKADIRDLRIPEGVKIYTDDTFKEFKPLPIWEVW